VGSLTVYYVPWRLADILTNYTRFNSGIDDIGEFLSALVESGVVLAAIVAFARHGSGLVSHGQILRSVSKARVASGSSQASAASRSFCQSE
jgi:hypothetical protein